MFRRFVTSKSFHIVTMTMLSLLLCSCVIRNDDEHRSYDELNDFVTIEVDTTKALFSSYEKPDCHLHLNFEVPTSASSGKVLSAAKSLIVSLADDDENSNSESEIEEMIRQYTRSYILSYLEEGNDAIANFSDDIHAGATWMTYEEIREGKVLYNSKGIFSYSVKTYSYTGGAHGNSMNRVASIDLKKRKLITLDSLFGEDRKEELKTKVWQTLNEKFQLLTDDVELTENFFVNAEGVTFVFDPLDIAAYSDGEIAVTMEWDNISHLLLNPNFNK